MAGSCRASEGTGSPRPRSAMANRTHCAIMPATVPATSASTPQYRAKANSETIVTAGTRSGAAAATANRCPALSMPDQTVAMPLTAIVGKSMWNNERVKARFSGPKFSAIQGRTNGKIAASTADVANSNPRAHSAALEKTRVAAASPSRAATWTTAGINAVFREPATTVVANAGSMKATRKASMSSPRPKWFATTMSFRMPATRVSRLSDPMTAEAAKMRRLADAEDHSSQRRWRDARDIVELALRSAAKGSSRVENWKI